MQMNFYDRPIDTLEEAKKEIIQNIESGVKCRCCGQWAMRYRFALSEKNVYALACLYKMTGGDGYVHIDRLADYARIKIKGGTSFSILAWWGLIAERANDDEKKKSSGFWRITDKGIAWLGGDVRIPKYVYSFNDEIMVKPADPLIDVQEVPWKEFNYAEIMRPTL